MIIKILNKIFFLKSLHSHGRVLPPGTGWGEVTRKKQIKELKAPVNCQQREVQVIQVSPGEPGPQTSHQLNAAF